MLILSNLVRLLVKLSLHVIQQAENGFENTGIHISTAGKRHLGAALSDHLFVTEYVTRTVDEWEKQAIHLTSITRTTLCCLLSIHA